MKEEATLQVLRNIEKINSQKSLADKLGFSVGKINYILKALAKKGQVKVERFMNSRNKIQYKYILTKKGFNEKVELTKKFIAIKKTEYEELQRELRMYDKIEMKD